MIKNGTHIINNYDLHVWFFHVDELPPEFLRNKPPFFPARIGGIFIDENEWLLGGRNNDPLEEYSDSPRSSAEIEDMLKRAKRVFSKTYFDENVDDFHLGGAL